MLARYQRCYKLGLCSLPCHASTVGVMRGVCSAACGVSALLPGAGQHAGPSFEEYARLGTCYQGGAWGLVQ